jgi:hypothetical protein
VADEFKARHPEKNPITHSAMGKLVKKFKETGSVEKPQVGRPSVGEDIRTGLTAKFHAHSHWLQTFRTFCIIVSQGPLIPHHHLTEWFPNCAPRNIPIFSLK